MRVLRDFRAIFQSAKTGNGGEISRQFTVFFGRLLTPAFIIDAIATGAASKAYATRFKATGGSLR